VLNPYRVTVISLARSRNIAILSSCCRSKVEEEFGVETGVSALLLLIIGRMTRTSVPFPNSLRTSILPPSILTIERLHLSELAVGLVAIESETYTIDRPSPVPKKSTAH